MDDTTKPHEYRFIGKPLPRKEDERLITGKGRFTDDFALRRPGLCGDGALAASACAHRRNRRRAGESDAGRARRLHRRRLRGRQSQAHSARSGAEDQIRHEACTRRAAARCSSARRCCCPPTRCAMSAKPSPWWWPRPRRRRWTPPKRSRSATRNCRSCCIRKTRCGPARRRSGTKSETTSSSIRSSATRRRPTRPSRAPRMW